MDFDLTEEQRLILKTARDFAQREIAPKAAEIDKTARWPAEIVSSDARYGVTIASFQAVRWNQWKFVFTAKDAWLGPEMKLSSIPAIYNLQMDPGSCLTPLMQLVMSHIVT